MNKGELRSEGERMSWLELSDRYELPTWGVVALVYGGWLGLLSAYALLPWWVIMPVAAYLLALHGSLQHEASHYRPAGPLVSSIIAYPPLALWLPFPLYKSSHQIHHINERLTDPVDDTESYYWRETRWVTLPVWFRKLLMLNQTLLGRMVLGPALMISRTYVQEIRKLIHGDRSNLSYWFTHLLMVAGVLWLVTQHFGVPMWEYAVLMVYPALSLGAVRSFYEHRYDVSVQGRSVIVETNWFWRLLFMNNNYHVVHHTEPALPWFMLKRAYEGNKGSYQLMGKGFRFHGYSTWFLRFLFKPVYYPVHPEVEAMHHLPAMEDAEMAALPMDQARNKKTMLPELVGAPPRDE